MVVFIPCRSSFIHFSKRNNMATACLDWLAGAHDLAEITGFAANTFQCFITRDSLNTSGPDIITALPYLGGPKLLM